MRTVEKFFHCGDQLMKTLASEIAEIRTAMTAVPWKEEFSIEHDGRLFSHQTAYNKVFEREFDELGWENQPALRSKPTLKGDFRKGLVFVEIQFGNSATLYRDYYKFQYGLANGLLSLAVLVVPSRPKEFFPTRREEREQHGGVQAGRSISQLAAHSSTNDAYWAASWARLVPPRQGGGWLPPYDLASLSFRPRSPRKNRPSGRHVRWLRLADSNCEPSD